MRKTNGSMDISGKVISQSNAEDLDLLATRPQVFVHLSAVQDVCLFPIRVFSDLVMQILRGCFGEKISYKVQICHPPLLA
jgi:hypothetical protein